MLVNLHFFFTILCGVQICLRGRQAGLGCRQVQFQLVDNFATSFNLPPKEFHLFYVCLLPLGVVDGLFAHQHTEPVRMVHLLFPGVDFVYTDVLLQKKKLS